MFQNSALLIPEPPMTKAKLLFTRAADELAGLKRILDLGGGTGSTLTQILQFHPNPQDLHIISLDIWMPAIHHARDTYGLKTYVQGNALHIPLRDQSVDAVLMMDIIEHFTVSDAIQVLRECRRVARRKILVYTPTGFMEQDEEEGNPYQKHLSGWRAQDFRRLGFEVEGHGYQSRSNGFVDDPLDMSLALFARRCF